MKLIDWRKGAGVSRACLAEMLSARMTRRVAQSTIQGWENGIMPPADAFAAIQRVTGGKVKLASFTASGSTE